MYTDIRNFPLHPVSRIVCVDREGTECVCPCENCIDNYGVLCVSCLGSMGNCNSMSYDECSNQFAEGSMWCGGILTFEILLL